MAAGLCSLVFESAEAQIDYRNLDPGRPMVTEDAYPIERYAFELAASYRFESEGEGRRAHVAVPEIAYGIVANAEIGIQAPVAAVDIGSETDWGLSGLQIFGLYNFNSEAPLLPAFSVRGSVSLPVGSLKGEGTRVTIKGIATRSWGRSRLHLNVARSFGSEDQLAAAEPALRWEYSGALDRTLFRQSLLLIGEVAASQAVRESPTEINASLGVRYQWTPTLVLDAGLTRRLRNDLGPNLSLTLGLSHVFGL